MYIFVHRKPRIRPPRPQRLLLSVPYNGEVFVLKPFQSLDITQVLQRCEAGNKLGWKICWIVIIFLQSETLTSFICKVFLRALINRRWFSVWTLFKTQELKRCFLSRLCLAFLKKILFMTKKLKEKSVDHTYVCNQISRRIQLFTEVFTLMRKGKLISIFSHSLH